ncbi:S1/P1 nuclease [Kozakia baliensis]|uniref:S1/P1 nuclease n=1 Tax=Kozakia baliensis TaxID=153496 RepID=UPI001F3A79CF|nr:S1/P1 nuclease [Kozakia baliensis]
MTERKPRLSFQLGMKMGFRVGLMFSVVIGACVLSPQARAWGPYGHAIVADIAQDRLTPQAAQQAAALLALEGHQTLDQVASWPDAIAHVPKAKGGLPETLPWHYVDIDVTQPTYEGAKDCGEKGCVTEKLPEMERLLADPTAPAEKRLVALKWVVHLVGDLHQPLHAAERDKDLGGNKVKLTYFGDNDNGHMNLHSLWDEGVLDREANLQVGPHYSIDFGKARHEAETLNSQITPGQAQLWASDVVVGRERDAAVAWTNESHALARAVAYGALPSHWHGEDIGESYTDIAWPVIQVRLEQAGVRLAAVLNNAFSQTAPISR